MIYRDPQNRIIQENANSEDQNLARLMVGQKALETARAEVLALELIVHGYQGHVEAGTGRTGKRNPNRTSASAAARDRKENPEGEAR